MDLGFGLQTYSLTLKNTRLYKEAQKVQQFTTTMEA